MLSPIIHPTPPVSLLPVFYLVGFTHLKNSSQISCKFEIIRDLMMIYLPPCTSNYFHTVCLHIGLLSIWTFLCRSRNFPTRLIWRGLPSQSLWICHLQDDHVMSLWMAAWGASLDSPIFWALIFDWITSAPWLLRKDLHTRVKSNWL